METVGSQKELTVSLYELVVSLSDTLDLISPLLSNHHSRVSYIAFRLAGEQKLAQEKVLELVLAGALHDAGALTLKQRIDTLSFESDYREGAIHRHALQSYSLLKSFIHLESVAEYASMIARLADLPESKCLLIRAASYLHDLGKLAVPTEILEKPQALTKQEENIIKQHPYYTYRTLETVKGLEEITAWAAHHHERPDGRGMKSSGKA